MTDSHSHRDPDKRSGITSHGMNLPTRVPLIMKSPIELVPSYDWKPLHVWHTIPIGLTTRLPIGTSGSTSGIRDPSGSISGTNSPHKEARISEPWRLQLALPKVSKSNRLKHKYYNPNPDHNPNINNTPNTPNNPDTSNADTPTDMATSTGTGTGTKLLNGYCVTKSSFLRMSMSRSTTIASIM